VADTDSMLRYDVEPIHPVEAEVPGEGDLSFAVFSLAHAACGDDVLEVRIGDRMLLEWCTGCAVMEVFGSWGGGGGGGGGGAAPPEAKQTRNKN
jgi:hypothetical protein